METITVIIETPKGSQIKIDYDEKIKTFKVKKLMPAGMVFPFDFGYIPGTVGGDGDPLDVICISEFSTFTGCAIDCKIVGAIIAVQKEKNEQAIRNDRLLAVPEASLLYKDTTEADQLPTHIINQLQDFFTNYNKEAGKEFTPLEVCGSSKAYKVVEAAGKKNNPSQIT